MSEKIDSNVLVEFAEFHEANQRESRSGVVLSRALLEAMRDDLEHMIENGVSGAAGAISEVIASHLEGDGGDEGRVLRAALDGRDRAEKRITEKALDMDFEITDLTAIGYGPIEDPYPDDTEIEQNADEEAKADRVMRYLNRDAAAREEDVGEFDYSWIAVWIDDITDVLESEQSDLDWVLEDVLETMHDQLKELDEGRVYIQRAPIETLVCVGGVLHGAFVKVRRGDSYMAQDESVYVYDEVFNGRPAMFLESLHLADRLRLAEQLELWVAP